MTIPDAAGTTGDRRGRPLRYISYWSQRRREQRAAVFRRHEAGMSASAIAEELGLPVAEVEAVLRSDQRGKAG